MRFLVGNLHMFLNVLIFILMSTPCLAALPFRWLPADTPDTYKVRWDEAWREAMILARAAALTFEGTCDPVYQRYFEEAGASLVKHIFRK